MGSSYLHKNFVKWIDKDSIKTIVECGSRDCFDAIALNEFYNPDIIYSFECNPESFLVCKKNIRGIDNIRLINKAVYNHDCPVVFYATDMDKSIDKNIGASSLLWHRDNENEFFQKEITVEGMRLDTFMENYNVENIDLLCMDLQGTEHIAIDSLGERIKDIKYIITEVTIRSHYKGDMLRGEMRRLLHSKGFRYRDYFSGNILFERDGRLYNR